MSLKFMIKKTIQKILCVGGACFFGFAIWTVYQFDTYGYCTIIKHSELVSEVIENELCISINMIYWAVLFASSVVFPTAVIVAWFDNCFLPTNLAQAKRYCLFICTIMLLSIGGIVVAWSESFVPLRELNVVFHSQHNENSDYFDLLFSFSSLNIVFGFGVIKGVRDEYKIKRNKSYFLGKDDFI
ncbi:hypothetical protein L1D15_19425 [Vibrio sp. Isolate25]|uniref:hypothetical protein n=1 Tax=Vibrio sp. Isolate25 TaxID=2908535 RepID=UPI001EFC8800|nr:hypothetical protein [Vibrio sp. Isolate25]MCG9598876.1 hypothetical protein [Vibrio sp. Isolate25]